MKLYFIILAVIFLAMQLIQPDRINKKVDSSLEINAPKKVEAILKRSCYDCHSFETKWPSYSAIAPLSWTIADHVKTGRAILNYSLWKSYDDDKKIKKFQRTIQTLRTNIMPIPSYLWIHKDAKLSKKDKELLINWSREELKKLGVKTF